MARKIAVVFVALAACLGPGAASAGDEPAPPAAAPQFAYCSPATFADCTKAHCKPLPDGSYSCRCPLDGRYSAVGYESGCVQATATTAQSRYHPIASYQLCSDRDEDSTLWAWCLGVACKIDKDGKHAACACSTPPPGVPPIPYVITTATYLPQGCQGIPGGEVYSSATPDGVAQITAFLQQQPGHQDLEPPIVLLGEGRP